MRSVITNHLDIWSSAQLPQKNGGRGRSANSNKSPHGIQKLRELILELAVRGKLVPQEPNDEPASGLLKRIAVEKERLVREGKIKKQKTLPPIGKDEIWFDIAVGWEWARLGDSVEVLDSLRKPITKSERTEGPYPYYGASGVVDYVADYIFDEPLVLVGEDGAKWGKGERTAFSISGKTWVNNHAHVLRPDRKAIIDSFLVYYLTSADLSEFITGMTVPKLNQKRLLSIPLPIPPLEEQHRIVAKVDELMALCDQLEQEQTESGAAHQTLVETLLGTLTRAADAEAFAEAWQRIAAHFDILFTTEHSIDQLKQTILQLAVMSKLVPQDPNDEPASELLKKIAAERAKLIKAGKIKKKKPLPKIELEAVPYRLPTKWSWVRLAQLVSIQTGKKDVNEGHDNGIYPFFSCAAEPLRSNDFSFDCEALLLPGNGANVGLVMHHEGKFEAYQRTYVLNHFFQISARYISLTIQARFLQSLEGKQYGSAINYIKLGNLTDFLVPLPPLVMQYRIVAKVDELMAVCDNLKERLQEAHVTQVQLADVIVEQAVS